MKKKKEMESEDEKSNLGRMSARDHLTNNGLHEGGEKELFDNLVSQLTNLETL